MSYISKFIMLVTGLDRYYNNNNINRLRGKGVLGPTKKGCSGKIIISLSIFEAKGLDLEQSKIGVNPTKLLF